VIVAAILALGAFVAAPPAGVAAATDYVAKCAVNVRTSPSLSATIKATLSTGDGVSVSGTVAGDPWSGTCVTSISGSNWYVVTAVNGQSVASLYGVSAVYAATGFFRPTSYLEGIDVSRWQGTIDFAKVKGAGKRFVIAKATEGIGFRDANYTANRGGALGTGLAFTAYHYARPDLNPTNAAGEADWFVDNLGLVAGMLRPALDLEVASSLGTAGLQQWVSTWLARVYQRTGTRPMIYTSPAFWKKYLGDTTMFADQGYTVLWVAHWFVSAPTVPAANWGGRGWTFWQYDNCGTVPGIGGCVDLDRYNGADMTPVTFGADFALSASPSSRAAEQGTTATFSIGVARTYFTLPVDLSFSGLPPGATATLSPTSATGTSATLTVTTSNSGTVTPVGSYPLTVTGTSNGLTRTTTATLAVTDGIAPKPTAPRSRLSAPAKLGSSTTPVRTDWSASDPSGIASYGLQRQVNGGSWTWVTLSSAAATSTSQSLSFGALYRYRVRATDGNGNAGSWTYGPSFTPLLTQQSSSAVSYGGTWTTASSTYYSGGSIKYATAPSAWASYTFTGSSVSWVAYRGPNRGSAAVYLDGVKYATVNLYSSSYSSLQVVYTASWGANGTHTIKIVCLGTSGHPRVDVDAFVQLVQS
jgi:GH25 family lysozyme M1 (1,4-beta-N-acetylmuramidase)